MQKAPKIHDNTIKYFLSDRKNAISVIRALLPKKVQEHLDLDKIRYEKDTFIPKHLREYFSDLLTSVPTKCGTSESKVLFLLEHKSTFKRFTPLQFLRYILEFWDFYLRNAKRESDKLPVVIPILIAHPEYGWRALKISDLVNLPSDDFKVYIPDFEFLLFDAVKDDPENYEFDEALKALFTIWKYAHSPEFMEGIKKAFRLIKKIDPDVRLDEYLKLILQYLELNREEKEYAEIKKIAETELDEGEQYMGTIAEMFRNEGKHEGAIIGRQEGKLENAQETLIDQASELYGPLPGMLSDKIRSIQSIDNLRVLARKIIRTESLDEFTELVNKAALN
ncbi:Rpn family recombination-promoting nuclease/putative transposase [Desulfonatronovibrio magnus]|uniref:Rpn family recombination-promoting nuclease/putative transposase n=1 Tax=Desulfonatronovibrio magnus TaxID=698827 RepID=UPI0005EBB8B8|nr:Rpn family recombination-promoting nuclease/putative transposase [Desulfonatronovibrio magnus]